MNKGHGSKKQKEKLKEAIANMIDEGSDKVTTLSYDTEAKYECIAEKVPGDNE